MRKILHLAREGKAFEAYGNRATFALGRYENWGVHSRTRLDLKLTHDNFTDSQIMTFLSNGRVGIGAYTPDQLLTVGGEASKIGGGFWATFSDRRVKKDIRPYTRGLNEIKQINPVWYKYNELSGYKDTETDYVGIIAQEMEHVLPSTVSEFDDSNNSGISDKKQ